MARIWHAPSYHSPKGFAMPKGGQNYIREAVLSTFLGVLKLHNPIKRAACSSLKERCHTTHMVYDRHFWRGYDMS